MKIFALLSLAFFCFALHASPAAARKNPLVHSSASDLPTLKKALMCERVENLTPINPGLVFSVSSGEVCCFTSFDPVPQHTVIYQRWFHRDELSTQVRLRLYPKKWATYSAIQLRETDKGPWRVEIVGENGHVFDVLRFSITD